MSEPVDSVDAAITAELHRLLVASVVDYAIYGLTATGRVATWNAGASRLKGYAAAEIVGRSVSEFYPPEERDAAGTAARAMSLLEQAAREGRAEDDGWRVRRDGTRFWANVIVTPIRDERGTLLGFAKVTRDLTTRRAAEQHARDLAAAQAARAAAERNEAELRDLSERLQQQAVELEVTVEHSQELAAELEQINLVLRETVERSDEARSRAEALQLVTASLARAQTLADVGRVFSQELTTLVGADTAWVGVVTRDGREIEALGWAGYPDDASSQWRRLPIDANIALSDAVRSAQPQWWTTRAALVAAYPARAGVIRTAAQESAAILPLLANIPSMGWQDSPRSAGGIVVGFREQQEFDEDTRIFFIALAQQCAAAVARARAFEAEQVARAEAYAARLRAEQLQALTAALARAVSAEAVIDAAIVEGGHAVGSASGALALLEDNGRSFMLVPGPGMPRDVSEEWHRFPNEGLGQAAEAVRTLEPSFSRTRAEFADRSPELAALAERLQLGASVALPLVIAKGDPHQRVLGILSFTFDEPRAFERDEEAFLRAVADQCAQALDRARLFQAEQTGRQRAEVLQTITAALASAGSSVEVARAALRAAVKGSGAPAGTLALLSADGLSFEKVADVGLSGHAMENWERFPTHGPYPAADVMSTGAPQFLVDQASYAARYPTMVSTIQALGIQASAVLPLTTSGSETAIGYLSLHFPKPHPFPQDESTFLSALARVTAQAIDRARLFEAEQRARAEAEAANQAKGQFLATMSHELRTPLNAIGGYAELLELGIHGPISADQRTALGRIQRSQKHLLSLINEVLNYARMEAGAVEYDMQDVGLLGVLTGVESVMLPQVRAKGIGLAVQVCPPELAVRADAEKLGQVLLNLLSNAVKFTDVGGTITVNWRIIAGSSSAKLGEPPTPSTGNDAADHLEIAVADTGMGIRTEDLTRIFEPFVQVGRSLTSRGEGTGLGLAISRDLARGMGGDLSVDSILGEGSIFTVRLRRA